MNREFTINEIDFIESRNKFTLVHNKTNKKVEFEISKYLESGFFCGDLTVSYVDVTGRLVTVNIDRYTMETEKVEYNNKRRLFGVYDEDFEAV